MSRSPTSRIDEALQESASEGPIWVLDADPACVLLYRQTLGLCYPIESFACVKELIEALSTPTSSRPRLLLADPENTEGSLAKALQGTKGSPKTTLPEFMIISREDQLDLIRFYLKAGARDYILKPIKPNELIAKVERALNQIHNREILILRNDLDGLQISDLTFREHQLLTIFLSREDRKVSRDELQEGIWKRIIVNRKTLDVHVFNLRRKLRPLGYEIVCVDQVFSLERHRA